MYQLYSETLYNWYIFVRAIYYFFSVEFLFFERIFLCSLSMMVSWQLDQQLYQIRAAVIGSQSEWDLKTETDWGGGGACVSFGFR